MSWNKCYRCIKDILSCHNRVSNSRKEGVKNYVGYAKHKDETDNRYSRLNPSVRCLKLCLKSFFKGELLRATAYYFFRTRTTLSVDEIEVLMGRRPPSVYAQRYIDWNNVRVLLRQSLLLEQEWYSHIKALSPRNKQEGLHFISLSGSTQADTTLEIQAQYGIRGCIMIQKEGRA